MSDTLSNFHLDVADVLDDLMFEWQQRSESNFNSFAFKRKPGITGESIMFCCPVHAENRPSAGLQINHPYYWHCFGCGAKGSLGSLVALAAGLRDEFQGELHLLKNYVVTTSIDRPPIDMESILDGTERDRKSSLLEEELTEFSRFQHTYMKRRGFSERTLQKYEIGFDKQAQAVTFPVRTSKGQVRFIKKRFVDRKGFLNATGIDKKDILYGLYYLLQAPTPITSLYLTESETDVLACYEARLPACALLGRILFKEQIKELVSSGIKHIYLFVDNDQRGVECAIKSYLMLSQMTAIRVKLAIYPGGQWGIDGTGDMLYKDANDLLKAQLMHAVRFVSFEEFVSKLKYKEALELGEQETAFI